MFFYLEIGPAPTPLLKANNVEHYTFVTLSTGKCDTPHSHLHYLRLIITAIIARPSTQNKRLAYIPIKNPVLMSTWTQDHVLKVTANLIA